MGQLLGLAIEPLADKRAPLGEAAGRPRTRDARPLSSGWLGAGQGDPRWELYETCERLAATSWQGESETGTTLSHAAIRPFLRACHARAAEAVALDLNLLYVGQRAVAFNYAYHLRGHVYGLRTGYEECPTLAGAGSVLQARMIEDSFRRGDHTYDLGPDYLECKRHWLTETRRAWRYTHFAAGAPIAQLIRARRTAKRWLAARAAAGR